MLPAHLAYGALAKPPPLPPCTAPGSFSSSPWQAACSAPSAQRTLSKAPPGPPPGWASFQGGPQPPGDFGGPRPPGDFGGPPVGEGRRIYGATFRPPPPPQGPPPPPPRPCHLPSSSDIPPLSQPTVTSLHHAMPSGTPGALGPPVGRPGPPSAQVGPSPASPPKKRRRKRPSPQPFKGGQHVASTSWRESQDTPDQAPPAHSSRSSHCQAQADQASPEPRSSRAKAEQAPPAHSRRSSQPRVKADEASPVSRRRRKAEQASPERCRRTSQVQGKADQASAEPRRRDKAVKASSMPRRRSARDPSPGLPSQSSEHELSPGKELPPTQVQPRTERSKKLRVKTEADEQQRTRAQPDASNTASTSPEGDPPASQRGKSPSPTKFEASLVEWERRRQLEEEVGRAETLAARRRLADPGLRPGEIRSHCCQRASPRRPRRPRDIEP